MTETSPKLANQCKLCRLLHLNPDLWTEIHDKILKQGESQASVCRWANSKIETINAAFTDEKAKLPELSVQNFSRHFKYHNNMELHKDLKRQRFLLNNRNENQQGFSDEEVDYVKMYTEEYASNALSEYEVMCTMVNTLERKLWEYDAQYKKKDLNSPNRRININEIEGYQKQIESLFKLKLELAKFRNTSLVTGQAVRSAVENTVSQFVETMMIATEESLAILRTELIGSSVPEEVTKLVRNRIADEMKSSVPNIIEKILKDYNIR